MPRILWLGLIACIAVLLGALALMGEIEPADELVASTSAQLEGGVGPTVELAAESTRRPTERSTVTTLAPEANNSAQLDSGPATLITASGYHGSDEPVFHDGVVEVRVVRDEDDSPIEGASVALETEAGSESLLTDATGSVMFTSIAITYWGGGVSAAAPGRPSVKTVPRFDTKSRRAVVELRPYLERQVLVRIVDPIGLPFRAADWQIEREEAQKLGIVLTGACGRIGGLLEIGGAPTHHTRSTRSDVGAYAWVVVIRGRGPACVHAVLGDTVVGVAQLDPSATEAEVRVDPDALASAISPVILHVVDAIRGTPIEGAQVEFTKGSVSKPNSGTDAAGRVDAGSSVAAKFGVTVRARGYAPQSISIARPIPPAIVVRMHPGRRITGRVVDRDGVPIANPMLGLDGDGTVLVKDVLGDADGMFVLEDLPASHVIVTATHRPSGRHGAGVSGSAQADCRVSDVLGLEVVIDASKIAAQPKPR